MSTPIHELSIAEASALLRTRALSPVEMTRALLDRITQFEPQINAFIAVTAERAMADAQRAEGEILRGKWKGPLHGVPYGLKDMYNTAGIATTAHSRVAIDHVPAEDATVVARLQNAGAVLMGKLSTYQFTHGGPSFQPPWPPARNPWNTAHEAGGSSSGSGAAVAAGFVPGTLGTDTGGSVRVPASFCGLAGLKPTFGLLSRCGVIPNSWSFDHCGPMAWTVEDCALLLQVTAGFDPLDPSSADVAVPHYADSLLPDLKGLRIGVVRHFWEEDIPTSEDLRQTMDYAIQVLRDLGAQVQDVRLRTPQEYYDVKNIITKSEIFCVHRRDLAGCAALFGSDFLGTTLGGSLFSAVDYVQAQRDRVRMVHEIEAVFGRVDVLLTANAGPAPRMVSRPPLNFWNAPLALGSLCIPLSFTGGPALSVCNGFSRDGLPLAMQIGGRPFDDATVLRVGHAFERATPWRERRPVLHAAGSVHPPQPAAPVPKRPPPEDGLVTWLANRAGLRLTPGELSLLVAIAPYTDASRARRWYPRDP